MRTYRVDTQNAGLDSTIEAASADEALFAVAEHAGRTIETPDGLVIDHEQTRGWTAVRVEVAS